MFYNRTMELDLLESFYTSQKAECFVLYGRRRVGKTELLAHFCKDKRAVFFVADLGSEVTLRIALSAAVNSVLFGPHQMNAVYSTWEDIFKALSEAARNERLVVVLDEFPYLVAAYPPFATLLQRIWDQNLKKSQIMLVLCGSYIGMMEEVVLGYQAPLYGRRTGQLLLEPLKFHEARQFFPDFSGEDQVRSYAIYGGIPAYLLTLDTTHSFTHNIQDGILSRGAFLYDEAQFLLQQELREPRNYFAILQAIAGGKTRLNEIKQATGIEGATAYLDTLQQLHLVERIIPATETQPQKSRKGLYRLKDNYLRFYFHFVLPNRSVLEQGGSQAILESIILPGMDSFISLVFEEICQQFLWRLALTEQLPFQPVTIGKWWEANEEIDLIAIGTEDALLGECKWSVKPVGTDILANLERKSSLIRPEFKNRRLALFSRSGFTKGLIKDVNERDDVILFDLKDILEL